MNNTDFKGASIFNSKSYIQLGIFLLVVFVGGIGSWMTFSRLDSAAIAPGIVTVEGQRKAVEHLEGGIVEEVLVHDGDVVKKGQALIRLSAITARTRFTQLNLKYFSLLAQEQRLHHERKNSNDLRFSLDLLEVISEYPSLASVLETQQLLFNARINLKSSELSKIDTQISAIESDKKMYKDKIQQEQIAFSYLNSEVEIHDKLLINGYSSQLKSMELKRTQAQYSSNLIDLKGRLKSKNIEELEAKEQKASTVFRYISDIEQELQEVSKEKDDTLELLIQAEDILSRVVLKSPHAGQIVGLTVFTKGDVISPGETLLQVVPFDERLIIVAKLKPEDIDVIHVGQSTMVRLSAYNSRSTPPINGKVIHVAADRLVDANSKENDGFTIKISIDPAELNNLNGVTLHPGMPAEVFIKLKARTPLDYLLDPLSLDLFRAFRES